jgi:hypothetical protein
MRGMRQTLIAQQALIAIPGKPIQISLIGILAIAAYAIWRTWKRRVARRKAKARARKKSS